MGTVPFVQPLVAGDVTISSWKIPCTSESTPLINPLYKKLDEFYGVYGGDNISIDTNYKDADYIISTILERI
jgi:hypothetical protein